MQYGSRTSQGGSIALFAMIAVLLSAAVIGSVYLVQKRGYSVRIDQPIMEVGSQDQPAAQPQQQSQTDEQKAAEQKRADEQKAVDEQKKADAQKRIEAEKQAAAAAEAERQRQAAATRPAAPAEVPHTGAAPQTLPTTGPADTAMQLIAGAIMVGLVAAYLKSYRHRFGSLLK